MRKEYTTIETVGQLLDHLQDVPRDTPLSRLTDGHYKIHKTGDIGVFVGQLPIGHEGKEVRQLVVEFSA